MANLQTIHSPAGQRSNLNDIDVFRGIAALIVLAFHTREIAWIGERAFWHKHELQTSLDAILAVLTFPLVWGVIGVPIFFVLSGYCIHRSNAFLRQRDASFQFSPPIFLLRRFFRIYPVLTGALLLTLLCDLLSYQYFPNSGKLDDLGLGAFLTNLAALQGIIGRPYGSNFPLWTLSIEIQFYIFYPILLFSMFRIGNMYTFIAILLLNIISYFFLERAGYVVFLSYYISWYWGVLIAEYEARGFFSTYLSKANVRAFIYMGSIFLLFIAFALFFISTYIAFQIWAFAFAIFLLAFLKRPQEITGQMARLLRWVGTFSFSIYIVHFPVIVLIHSILFQSAKQDSLIPFIYTSIAAIIVAYGFSLIFEKPALALSRMWKSKYLVVQPASQPVPVAQGDPRSRPSH